MVGQILGSLLLSVLGIVCCAWAFILAASLGSWTRWAIVYSWFSMRAIFVTFVIGVIAVLALGIGGSFMIHWGFNAWPIVWGVK